MVIALLGPYVGLLAFLYLALSVNVVRNRRRHRVALGMGDVPALTRAIRAHGNFAEYVPFCLVVLGLLAAGGLAAPVLHALGGLLVAGRLLHAYSVLVHEPRRGRFGLRVAAMSLTFTVLGVGGFLLIVRAFTG